MRRIDRQEKDKGGWEAIAVTSSQIEGVGAG